MALDWSNFAVVVGSASGALTGLLFVAVSLNRDRIAGHPTLRSLAGQTLVLFIFPLLLSFLLVLPGASSTALGVGLVAVAAVVAAVLLLVGRVKRADGANTQDRLAQVVDRASPNVLVVVLTLVGGCLQLAGDNGLYWVAGSSVLSLVGGVFNAWLFLTRT